MSKKDRILVGSCNSQYYKPVLWPSMSARNATAFVWAGDSIYGDTYTRENLTKIQRLLGKRLVQEATPDELRSAYKTLLNDPGYNSLLTKHTKTIDDDDNTVNTRFDRNVTILGAFDDHDYGVDNGDKFYQYKLESAQIYLNFIKQSNTPTTNLSLMEQRAKAGKGVYGVKVFDFTRQDNDYLLSDDEAGLESSVDVRATPLSNRSVAIYILDVRTNRDPWPSSVGKPLGWTLNPDFDGDFLGHEQWVWLETALHRSTAAVNIIVQGLQVHPDRYFDGNVYEAWGRFPMAQHRLYQAVIKSNVSVPVLVGGDVHKAELLRKDCRKAFPKDKKEKNSRMLLEVTTSGMTHSWGSNVCSRPNDKFSCRVPLMNFIARSMMHLAQNNHCWREVVHLKGSDVLPSVSGLGQVYEGSKSGYQYSLERNFGEFEFDWEERQLIVRILGQNIHDKPLISTKWEFDLISGIIPPADSVLSDWDFQRRYKILEPHGVQNDDWICVNYLHDSSLPFKLFSVISPGVVVAVVILAPLIIPFYILYGTSRRHSSLVTKQKQC